MISEDIYLIVENFLSTVYLLNERAKKPKSYGTKHNIYMSEIHTLEAIIKYPDANASDISIILSITNGALTQVVSKLIDKGLIETYCKSHNKKEVYYKPTTLGLLANNEHKILDDKFIAEELSFLSDLTKEEVMFINSFFVNVKNGIK